MSAQKGNVCFTCNGPLRLGLGNLLYCFMPGCPSRGPDVPPTQPPPPISPDVVNSPPHYNTGSIPVIDFILDQEFGYLDGQVVKYIARFRHKGKPLEDLRKCEWYLQRLISTVEGKE